MKTSTESTANRLPKVAAALFRKQGYEATSVRDIADHLGISKASLYHHITGKEDLLYDLSVSALNHIGSAVEAAISSLTDPSERLRAAIEAHILAMLEERDLHSTMLTEMRSLQGQHRETVLELRTIYEQRMRLLVSDAQSVGFLRKDCEEKYLTLSLLNLLNWTIFWWQPEGALSPADTVRILMHVFLDGARPR